MKKRTLATFLALCLMLSLLPVSVLAEEGQTQEQMTELMAPTEPTEPTDPKNHQ